MKTRANLRRWEANFCTARLSPDFHQNLPNHRLAEFVGYLFHAQLVVVF
jgi:hypothetical protein